MISNETAETIRQEVIKQSLKHCPLFSTLTQHATEELSQICIQKNISKGETLFREGEKAYGFFIVQSGSICLNRVNHDGKEQVIGIFEPIQCFAEGTLGGMEAYPANANALEDSTVILVRKEAFRNFIREKPDLALIMLASMSHHLRHLVQMIEDLKFKQIEGRLANWLMRNCTENLDTGQLAVDLHMTKKVLASSLGVASETLSRTLARFRSEDILSVKGKRIVVKDPDGLKSYMDFSR